MKKKLLVLLFFCSLLVFNSVAFGQANIQVYVNDEMVHFPDAAPFISNDRTLVPVRFIAESLGAEVKWSQATKEVTILKYNKEIVLKIGEKKARLGKKTVELDTSAIIKDRRTFVPLRFISETLAANVEWEQATRTVFITTNPLDQNTIIGNKEELFETGIAFVEYVPRDKYGFDIYENKGAQFILSDFFGILALIKDGKIIEQVSPYPSEDTYYYPFEAELEGLDYIGLYNYGQNFIELVENPYK